MFLIQKRNYPCQKQSGFLYSIPFRKNSKGSRYHNLYYKPRSACRKPLNYLPGLKIRVHSLLECKLIWDNLYLFEQRNVDRKFWNFYGYPKQHQEFYPG